MDNLNHGGKGDPASVAKRRNKHKRDVTAFNRELRKYKYQLINEREYGCFSKPNKHEYTILFTEMRRLWQQMDCKNKPAMVVPFLIKVKVFIKDNCPDYTKRLKC